MDSSSWTLDVRPRRWQNEALEAWEKEFKGVVSIVTGGGKTVFAFMCMLEFRKKYPDGRFVIVVPTTALLDQWYLSLLETLHVPATEIACFSGDEKAESPSVVNLLVINTARTLASWIASQFKTFLIVDECHHAGSPKNALALKGQHWAALGLSATPEREYDLGFQERIAPVVGYIVYYYDYTQAYHDGIIVPFELVNVRIDLLPDEQANYDRLSKRAAMVRAKLDKGVGSEEQLKRILQRRAAVVAMATMRIPAATKLVEQHHLERILVFHERVESANKIYGNLRDRNHRVTIYHTGIGPTVRRDNLRLFRRGIFDVLISCRALDEGLNIPETTVAIIASSTASYRQRIQRLGRVLRAALGKGSARIYTIYATDQEEKLLAAEAHDLQDVTSVAWYRISR